MTDEEQYRALEKLWRKGAMSDDAFKRMAAYISTHYWTDALTSIRLKQLEDEQA